MRGVSVLLSALALLGGCGDRLTAPGTPPQVPVVSPPKPDAEVPFRLIGHALLVPVRVDDAVDAQFILDTGIGLELVTKAFAGKRGLEASGSYEGKRMSGQKVGVPLTRLRSLAIGSRRKAGVGAGIFDTTGFPDAFSVVDGFLSMVHFADVPFTIDYKRSVVVIESEASLAERARRGSALPLRLDRDGPTLTLFVQMDVSAGEPAWVEVDTGSDALVLHRRYMELLGIDPASPSVKTAKGTDETQHEYVRWFTRMKSPIFPPSAPSMSLSDSPVVFQEIIYDGLVGHSYFKNFVVTYDLPRSRMILSRE